MLRYNSSEIESWERIYRANFINSLSGFKSASLIATVNSNGQTNLAIFSSVVHVGSNPPLIGYINRPRTDHTHTLRNIEDTGVYTINQIRPEMIKQSHQTSAKYPEAVSEFDAVGLTPEFIDGQQAPFVKESLVKFALRLEEIIPIKANDTSFVIGRIEFIQLDEQIVSTDGFLSLERAHTICSNGNDAYYSTQLVERLPYAKP